VFAPKARESAMNAYQIRQFVILLATIVCTTVMIAGCAPHKSVTLSEVDEVEIKTTDPLGLLQRNIRL
jgi:hypothetical protein